MLGITVLQPRYRELVLFKAFTGLRAEASRTYLSFLWWVLEPLLSMSVYYVVFGLLIQRGTEDFVAFLLVGLVVWQWFAGSIKHGMNAIHGNGRLMTQVDLPKEIFPTIEMVMDLVKFGFVFVLLLIFLWLYGFDISPSYLALPCVILVQLLLLTTFTYLTAAIVPFVPDLKFLIDALLQLVFFLSGIFYAGASIPEQYQTYFYLNPVANLIEAYRDILMDGVWPDWAALFKVGLFALAGVYGAQLLIQRFSHLYPRIVEA
ncbi:ABC-2 type transporter [Nitrosococcus halophilus Nc 4]|uniref:Transport permease protein n=1 Tax=Nitrosococcus halophilus (strain Nc4) TaxID=472759 RepID=D5C2L5_NITHN|nr:ABC transporter permease [Nitrosococcus halophilus]ADE16690.1 ABC-2 type transporter [Nitrosococcus halophilus Nc 4]